MLPIRYATPVQMPVKPKSLDVVHLLTDALFVFLCDIELFVDNDARDHLAFACGNVRRFPIFQVQAELAKLTLYESHDFLRIKIPRERHIVAISGVCDASFAAKLSNRFIEIIDDSFSKMNKDEITILDFGCGKSYLTFIVYYYFTEIKKVKAKVLGFDLKEDVVKNCNEIAKKYGYDNLKFYVNDVTKGEVYKDNVDMVITLHACDVATDFALYHAISHGVQHIFSVPCCQHEICSSIKRGGDFDLLLTHGLIKERFSALLTDSIRADILKKCGYEVDIIEFVDFAHSPKNLMLRCKLKKSCSPDLSEIETLMEKYHFKQKLYELVKNNM